MKPFRRKIDALGLVFPMTILITWYLVVKGGKIPTYILPSPENILRVLADFIHGMAKLTPYSGKFIENLSASFIRVIMGFGIAMVFGLFMGFLTGRIAIVKRVIDPMINAIRTVPGIGWLPIAIVWFGVGEKTTIFLISLASFFPIYINTAHGVSQVSPLIIRAGRMLGADKFTLFRTIVLPAAFPSVVVGMRLGLGIAWAYLVLGELTGVSAGLGAVMMDSRMMGQIEMIIVSMLCIAIMGILTDRLLLLICKGFYPYQEVNNSE